MGTTFVSIEKERGFWMRDSMLELFLRLAALHIEDPNEPNAVATTIRDQWLLASRGWFIGCIPHDLEEAVATKQGTLIVTNAIKSLEKALQSAPTEISPDALNLMGFANRWVFPLEKWALVEICQAFLDLIDGKVGGPPSDTTFMPGS